MGKLKMVELIAKNHKYIVTGLYEDVNETLLVITMFQQNIPRARTVAKVLNNKFISIEDIELERGIYEVRVQKLLNNQKRELDKHEDIYDSKVMAGDKYPVTVSIQNSFMYGTNGILVEINSPELELTEKDLYYNILKQGDMLRSIKYRVPMEGMHSRFFVADITPDQIRFDSYQKGMLNLSVIM